MIVKPNRDRRTERHEATKAEILDAVIEDWLQEEQTLLAGLADQPGSAAERLEQLAVALIERKRRNRAEDAELAALYHYMVAERPAALYRALESSAALVAMYRLSRPDAGSTRRAAAGGAAGSHGGPRG